MKVLLNNEYYKYTLIMALYEKSEDYLDCFWPVAISILNRNQHSKRTCCYSRVLIHLFAKYLDFIKI